MKSVLMIGFQKLQSWIEVCQEAGKAWTFVLWYSTIESSRTPWETTACDRKSPVYQAAKTVDQHVPQPPYTLQPSSLAVPYNVSEISLAIPVS